MEKFRDPIDASSSYPFMAESRSMSLAGASVYAVFAAVLAVTTVVIPLFGDAAIAISSRLSQRSVQSDDDSATRALPLVSHFDLRLPKVYVVVAWAIVALVTPYFFLDGIDLLGTILYRVVFYGLLAVAFALDLVTILSLRVVRLHTVDGCSLLDEGDALEPRVIAIPLWGSRRALAKATWSRLVAGP